MVARVLVPKPCKNSAFHPSVVLVGSWERARTIPGYWPARLTDWWSPGMYRDASQKTKIVRYGGIYLTFTSIQCTHTLNRNTHKSYTQMQIQRETYEHTKTQIHKHKHTPMNRYQKILKMFFKRWEEKVIHIFYFCSFSHRMKLLARKQKPMKGADRKIIGKCKHINYSCILLLWLGENMESMSWEYSSRTC